MTEINDNTLVFAKVRPEAIIPTKSEENAGYDIYACIDDDIVINPHETKMIPTGIAAAVSKDYYLQVQERGSTGTKGMKYGAGVIDSGYRNEIFIVLTNVNSSPIVISKTPDSAHGKGSIIYPATKAIAQLVVHIVPKMNVKEISYNELRELKSERGLGKLGSTGK